jgi:hypothetical protein
MMNNVQREQSCVMSGERCPLTAMVDGLCVGYDVRSVLLTDRLGGVPH